MNMYYFAILKGNNNNNKIFALKNHRTLELSSEGELSPTHTSVAQRMTLILDRKYVIDVRLQLDALVFK